MNWRCKKFRAGFTLPGFTLLELVLVLFLIALIAGLLAPAMARFTAGRAVENTARQIVSVARYAHMKAIDEDRTYRLNFDLGSRQYWLTADAGSGDFNAVTGEFGQRFTAPDGITLQVDVTPQPNVNLLIPPSVQQEPVQQSGVLLNGQQAGAAGSIMVNVHAQGQTYVEFQPTGRTDPVTIELTDRTRHSVQVICPTPTDLVKVQEGAP